MPTTVVTFYNASTRQYYVGLHDGVLEDADKERLCQAMNAEPACLFPYGMEPRTINLLYFQEFEEPDSHGVYSHVNGDRPIYEVIHQSRQYFPEYVI